MGQFAAQPHGVARSGFPDARRKFPSGIGLPKGFPADVVPDFKKLCAVPLVVSVGEKDTEEGVFPKDGSFGKNRVELAHNWVTAANQFLSDNCPQSSKIVPVIVPNHGHKGSSNAAQRKDALDFFVR